MNKLKKRASFKSGRLIKTHNTFDNLSPENRKLLFSFQYIDAHYCISHCEKEDKAALADQLRLLGSKTWAELHQAGRHKIGYEKIPQKAIKRKVPSHLEKEDITFLAFRFAGLKPMVGYRDREIFHIIWFDRNYSLYDHGS